MQVCSACIHPHYIGMMLVEVICMYECVHVYIYCAFAGALGGALGGAFWIGAQQHVCVYMCVMAASRGCVMVSTRIYNTYDRDFDDVGCIYMHVSQCVCMYAFIYACRRCAGNDSQKSMYA
jgi:hypothetical protein